MPKGLTRRYGQGHVHFVTFSWSQKKFVEKLQYMYMNPVQRRLVSHPKDWPWSGFPFYAIKDTSLVRIDPMRCSSP